VHCFVALPVDCERNWEFTVRRNALQNSPVALRFQAARLCRPRRKNEASDESSVASTSVPFVEAQTGSTRRTSGGQQLKLHRQEFEPHETVASDDDDGNHAGNSRVTSQFGGLNSSGFLFDACTRDDVDAAVSCLRGACSCTTMTRRPPAPRSDADEARLARLRADRLSSASDEEEAPLGIMDGPTRTTRASSPSSV